MFNLLKYYPIIQHLKNISPNMYRVKGDQIELHCPFCNDANRTNALNHGHLSVAISKPVFNCYRCSTSGVIISLLLQTNFDDDEIINELKSFVKYKFSKDYFKTQHHVKLSDIHLKIANIHKEFKKNYINEYNIFQQYIQYRIGNIINPFSFLIFPDFTYNLLSVGFMNIDGIKVCSRIINSEKYRYKMEKGCYYFQPKKFDNFKEIVMCEGPFDIINSYMYLPQFKNNFFISINSLRYVIEFEKLMIQSLLIGHYIVNIIFDKTVIHLPIIKKISSLTQQYNSNIKVKYWKPIFSKDISVFPKIMEIG